MVDLVKDKGLVRLVEEVLGEMPEDERVFPLIQTEAILASGNFGQSLKLTDHELFYGLLMVLREQYGIVLYTPQLEKDFSISDMNKRQSEVLGAGFSVLDSFYSRARMERAAIRIFSVEERGYLYLVNFGNKDYIMKPIQGEGEVESIRALIGLQYVPKNEALSEEWLVEEYVPGDDFRHVITDSLEASVILGNVFGALHQRGVAYGDRFGDHLKMSPRGPVLVDFGTSVVGGNFEEDIGRIRKYLGDSRVADNFAKVYEKVRVG